MSNLQTYYHFKLDFQKRTNLHEAQCGVGFANTTSLNHNSDFQVYLWIAKSEIRRR